MKSTHAAPGDSVTPMSDIGILNGPLSLIVIALIFGSPGLVLGAIPGALLWRRHRLHPVAGRMDGVQGPDLNDQILSRSVAGEPGAWPCVCRSCSLA